MTGVLRHRGPDDSGHWSDRQAGLALGQRRLAIIDLSPAGHQPMHSGSGRYVIVFNGEIYNHLEIRSAIEGTSRDVTWRGHSDTETLLAGIERWGVRATVERCVGMFALAVWDRERRRLTLVRDRIGEKPLYYGRSGTAFLFGSELKALRAHPAFRCEVDRGSLTLLLRHGYVPDPRSVFHGVMKLPPGTLLEVDESGAHGDPVPYWNAKEAIAAAHAAPFTGTETEVVDALERVLDASVALQMVADVPLGAFLSGGVDSSLIVALMQKRSSRPIRTFTIGFTERAYDESGYARAVASHLGTDHTELIVTPAQAMQAIPRMPLIYDEPFADSSQIPTFLVSQLAREHVTVSLSGDGGDELFGGYNRYDWAQRLWGWFGKVPGPLKRLATSSIRARSPEAWSRTLNVTKALVPPQWRGMLTGDRLHKLADLIGGSQQSLYRGLISHWPDPADVIVGGKEPDSLLTDVMADSVQWGFQERMMYWDLMTYLPSDILVKVDRAAMAVSLETRVPMLDHRVVEFAWSLPLDMRIRAGERKWPLKQLLARYVPRHLTDRTKTGFGIPIDIWLRGPLREWAEELLDEGRLCREGFLHPGPVRAKWREHLEGTRNWAYWLWDVLMFQAWWEGQSERAIIPETREPRTAHNAI
jgi:asparagine synthase (glutamine-hydrolysing)